MDLLTFSWQFLVIWLLLAANGFFVAAEFAIVKVRHTQIRPLIEKGDWRARIAMKVIGNLNAFLSACQLGITFTSIGLGWVGEPFLARWIGPVLQEVGIQSPKAISSISFVIAYVVITFLHIVIGELAPKTLAIQRPRRTALWTAPILAAFYYVFLPFIWVLNETANMMLRWFGVEVSKQTDHPFSHDELQYLLMHSTHAHPDDELINNIMIKAIREKETTAEQIMIPLEKVAVLWRDLPLDENLDIAQKAGYSRLPLCGTSNDEVLGIIHVKELLWQMRVLGDQTNLEHIMHPVLTFFAVTKLPSMLQLFRQSRNHLAIVVSPEDKMIGIVSFEDVLEELVGDIRDEFDVEKGPFFERTENSVLVDADMPLRDLAMEMDWPLPVYSSSTVEKWCLNHWRRVPEKGEALELDGMKIEAVETTKRGLRRVRLTRSPTPSE
jgi:CBS domain containing-hemolysin-like protein